MMLSADHPLDPAERARYRRDFAIAVAAATVGPLVTAAAKAVDDWLARRRDARSEERGNR
jgi:hypothetical protein